jgi:hypothetical protein
MNHFLTENLSAKEYYFQLFQQAQLNLELVCEESKETKICKKQRLWRERNNNNNSSK